MTPDGVSLCAGPGPASAPLPQLNVTAAGPHGTFLVTLGRTFTVPVDVRTATQPRRRFILALSGAGPNGAGAGESG